MRGQHKQVLVGVKKKRTQSGWGGERDGWIWELGKEVSNLKTHCTNSQRIF